LKDEQVAAVLTQIRSTRLPAGLHGDYLDLYFTNPFVNTGKLALNGKTIDMSRIKADSYVIAGLTDHITPWKVCTRPLRSWARGRPLCFRTAATSRRK
jgi:poly(3-hydroxyalkanoate) synthetase